MKNYNKHNDLISNFFYLHNKLDEYIQNEEFEIADIYDDRMIFDKKNSKFDKFFDNLDEVCYILKRKYKGKPIFSDYNHLLISRFKYNNWNEQIKLELSNFLSKNNKFNYLIETLITSLEEIKHRANYLIHPYFFDMINLNDEYKNQHLIQVVNGNIEGFPLRNFEVYNEYTGVSEKISPLDIYENINDDIEWLKTLQEKDISKKIILKKSVSQKVLINELHKIIFDKGLIKDYNFNDKKDIENFIYFITKKENDKITKHSLPLYNLVFIDKYKARTFVLCFYYLLTKGVILTKKMELFKILSEALSNRGVGVRTLQKEIEKIFNDEKYNKIKNSYLDFISS